MCDIQFAVFYAQMRKKLNTKAYTSTECKFLLNFFCIPLCFSRIFTVTVNFSQNMENKCFPCSAQKELSGQKISSRTQNRKYFKPFFLIKNVKPYKGVYIKACSPSNFFEKSQKMPNHILIISRRQASKKFICSTSASFHVKYILCCL